MTWFRHGRVERTNGTRGSTVCMMDFSYCPVSQNPNAALLGTKRESVAMAAGGSTLKKSVSESVLWLTKTMLQKDTLDRNLDRK